jgi:chromosome segregation ATPase
MINPDYERRLGQHESDLKEIYDSLRNIDHQTRSTSGTVLAQKTRLDRIEWDLRGVREEITAITSNIAEVKADAAETKANIAEILALLRPPTAD